MACVFNYSGEKRFTLLVIVSVDASSELLLGFFLFHKQSPRALLLYTGVEVFILPVHGVYVMCKVRIGTIQGLSCTNLRFKLCTTILGLHLTRDTKYGRTANPRIACIARSLDCTQNTARSMDSKEKYSAESIQLKIALHSQLLSIMLCFCL